MKKTALAFLLSLVSFIAQAQIPNGYYDNATGKTGEELKVALHNIIKGHHAVSYGGLLEAFVYTDCKSNGKIWDIYSNIEYSPTSSQCGNYDGEGDCWNREHTWPQSWFNENTTPRCDLFHVYPTDGYVNWRRSNYPYGEVNKPTYTSGNGSKLGLCVTSGYSGTVFEPIDEYKGDIARSYFYMSVRYHDEDSDWNSSGMTDKSEIKSWAMTMLLRWSDEDPVSQKEIDRNNAVYGYQSNRNPFIDHPEYARMIWDENWQGGVSYNITCATGLSHGSVSAPTTALEGSTVSITATPDAGYMVSSYSVYKTGSPSTTVSVNSNGTFTMPSYAVTVSASFTQNNTYYNISLGNVSHGSIGASANSAKSGSTINLTATPASGYSLYSWYVYKTGDMGTTVNVSGNSFVMPSFNVTVMATFVSGSNGDYVKVTSNPTDWSGEYLIVYENGNKAFNGGLDTLDATSNTITVSISSNTIAATSATDAANFTIAKSGTSYTIQSKSGYYIGATGNSNSLNSSTTTTYTNTISYNNGDVNIIGSGGAYLRYNATSGQTRFRYFKSSTYTNQQAIQLYKKTTSSVTPTHTIYFNNNGGTGSMDNQTVNEFEPAALQTNTFTREGFVFDGWNTMSDGTGDYYVDGATVTLLSDLTLYAQWNQLFTVTCADMTGGNAISASPTSALEDATITLTATPATGYVFDHWIVTDTSLNEIIVVENQFEMPASDVTVNAVFTYVGLPFEQKYHLVTSTNQLVAGRTYLIVNTANNKALGTTQNNNNRSAATVAIENNTISALGDACELTLGGQSGAWTFYDATNSSGYLYAAGGTGSNNYLKTQATLTNEGKWTITLDNSNNATIKTIVTTVARHTIMYNNGSTIFSCYASGQQSVCLFIRSEEYDHTGNETIANLFPFDKHTVRSGATLTVTGTAACEDPNLLIIKEGGQFIHHSDDVKAMTEKNITGYVGSSGWYTLASPFTDLVPGQLADGNYDLYAYDEDAALEWVNYKALQGNFTIEPGQGYLYAHNPSTTLGLTGTLTNGDYSETINLSYGNSTESLRGFNLLGNPTAHDITFTRNGDVSDGYYWVENGSTLSYETGNTVPAGRGFFVKANAANQSVTLNPQSRGGSTADAYLCFSIDNDKAYIKMNEGVSMPLLALNGKSPQLSLTKDGKSYVMLVREQADNIDLNFKTRENGNFTLTVTSTLNSQLSTPNFDYLHLIDRKTGADIDLLATPSYSFKSTVSDYPSRFQLRFSADSGSDSDQFAFYADGRIVVNGEGTLQVIDMLGRVILTSNLSTLDSQLSILNFKSGIYVLRLTTPEKVRVQKIVINK